MCRSRLSTHLHQLAKSCGGLLWHWTPPTPFPAPPYRTSPQPLITCRFLSCGGLLVSAVALSVDPTASARIRQRLHDSIPRVFFPPSVPASVRECELFLFLSLWRLCIRSNICSLLFVFFFPACCFRCLNAVRACPPAWLLWPSISLVQEAVFFASSWGRRPSPPLSLCELVLLTEREGKSEQAGPPTVAGASPGTSYPFHQLIFPPFLLLRCALSVFRSPRAKLLPLRLSALSKLFVLSSFAALCLPNVSLSTCRSGKAPQPTRQQPRRLALVNLYQRDHLCEHM